METGETESTSGIAKKLPLSEAYRALNDQRIDADRRMTVLAPDDPARDLLWQELEAVLLELGNVVSRLAKSHPAHLPELRAKADVMAALLRAGDGGCGPMIPEDEKSALALSTIEDIARLTTL